MKGAPVNNYGASECNTATVISSNQEKIKLSDFDFKNRPKQGKFE